MDCLEAAVSPVGPPQRCVVVAGLFLRFRKVSVDEYPSVIASTRSAPGITGGLPTGMSKQRHPTPTAKLISKPIRSFIGFLHTCYALKSVKDKSVEAPRSGGNAWIARTLSVSSVTVSTTTMNRNYVFPLLLWSGCFIEGTCLAI